jgi:hypothetical protein
MLSPLSILGSALMLHHAFFCFLADTACALRALVIVNLATRTQIGTNYAQNNTPGANHTGHIRIRFRLLRLGGVKSAGVIAKYPHLVA